MTIKKPKFKLRPKKASKLHRKMGQAPGTDTYMGQREGVETVVSVINYDENEFNVIQTNSLEKIKEFKDSKQTSWFDVTGISDEGYIDSLGKMFELNSLVLEDVVNPQQRPKIDEYEDYILTGYQELTAKDIQDISRFNVRLAAGLTTGLEHFRISAQYQYGLTNILGGLNGNDLENDDFKGNSSTIIVSGVIYF